VQSSSGNSTAQQQKQPRDAQAQQQHAQQASRNT